MIAKPENPVVFPDPLRAFNHQHARPSNAGIVLRDYFAAKAMQGDWAAQNDGDNLDAQQ